MIPESTSMRSKSGQERRNWSISWGLQKPITRSTPALRIQYGIFTSFTCSRASSSS
jgi:hypothetical protein